MEKRFSPFLRFIAFIGCLLLPFSSRSATSSFDAGDEGWSIVSFSDLYDNDYSVVGTYTPTFAPAGGDPGGFISTIDPDGGDFTFSAPGAYLGDQSGKIGGTFSYALRHTGSIDFQTTDVLIAGNGLRLVWQSQPPLTPSAAWSTVSLVVAPSPEWHFESNDGALASLTDFQDVMGNVTGVYIRGEFTNGQETAGLDNVYLVPEPSTASLLLAALLLFALLGRRLRREAPQRERPAG